MSAHYITDNPSGYRGRLFPLDNRACSLSLFSLFAFDANEYSSEDTEEKKRVQLRGRKLERCSFDGNAVHIIKTLANEEQAVASVGPAH